MQRGGILALLMKAAVVFLPLSAAFPCAPTLPSSCAPTLPSAVWGERRRPCCATWWIANAVVRGATVIMQIERPSAQTSAQKASTRNRRILIAQGVGACSFFLCGGVQRARAQLYVPTDGSELAPIAKDGKPSPIVLVPLIQAQQQLERIAEFIEAGDLDSWREANLALARKPFFPTKELKRLFNAYTDNIYFSDSSRRNMYLDGSAMLGAGKSTFGFGTLAVGAGGASPESKDTLTYLYRNEVLNNVEALAAEIGYLLKQADQGKEESDQDLRDYLQKARDNFNKYLECIPQQELQQARNYVKATAK